MPSDLWRAEIDRVLAEIEVNGLKSLEARQAAMPATRHTKKARKRWDARRDDWKAYTLSDDQKAIVKFLRDAGPSHKKALYDAVYAPRDIKPFTIDHDVDCINRLLQIHGYWIRSGREKSGKRWIEKVQPLTDHGLPVLLEDFEGIADLEPQSRQILRHLLDYGQLGVSKQQIMDDLWRDDENGGPMDPNALINVQLHRLRRALAPNYVIKTYGYNTRYRLQVVLANEVAVAA